MRRLPQIDPELAEIEEVRCFGCGRLIGVTPGSRIAVYCEELCWYKDQVINLDGASRNRAIRYLIEHGISMVQLSKTFGIARSVIGEMLAQGNEGDYLSVGRKEPPSDELRATRARAGKLGGPNRWRSRE